MRIIKFYYVNNCGDSGYFSEKDLIKAIYTAWNIEADLYLLNSDVKKLSKYGNMNDECQIVFCPYEGNEFNSVVLEEFGYKMIDGDEHREIVNIHTNKVEKYDWGEVKQLL